VLFFNNFLVAGILSLLSLIPRPPAGLVEFGDQLLLAGQADQAVTEYKRYIFLHSGEPGDETGIAYYKMGLAYRQQGLWDNALDALQKAIQTASGDEARDEWRIAQGVTLIAAGRFDQADFLLLKVEMYSASEEAKKDATFFRGVSGLYTSKYDQAREAFRAYFRFGDAEKSELGAKVDGLLARVQKKGYKSPRLAKTLSSILPGLGQMYAADWLGGFNALAINGATGALLVYDLLEWRWQNALFNSVFFFERFYRGNRINAEEAAKTYNQNLSRKTAAEILRLLEKT
jgi:tetratricopeptide (TPR) repeat protein